VTDSSRRSAVDAIRGAGRAVGARIARVEDARLLTGRGTYVGNPLATTFIDYLLPTAGEVPLIEYSHIETTGPGPGGFKGVGEGGAIGAPPAVVNAVADALSPFGVDVTRLPLNPSRIVDLVDHRRT
jgi:aerobic carbon-monoxide dehydrogenase large subunit